MGRYPFVLRLAVPGDFEKVRRLVQEAADWLRESKDTNQWARPWPDRAGHRERILNDLIKGKTWIAWDGPIAAATITIDTEEPLDRQDRPIWPPHKGGQPALYVRRVVVGRGYAHIGLGAGLLDWATDVARRHYKLTRIRIDVWTTNAELHAYYEGQGFTRSESRDPGELGDYPSQALFERDVRRPGSDYTKLFSEEGLDDRRFRGHRRPQAL